MSSTIEKDYYENDAFWDGALFTDDDRERVSAVAARIPPVRSLLDVGCGNGLFLETVRKQRPEIGLLHGTDRSVAALRRVRADKTPASIDSLPFADRAFECVSCLEVIEHLPRAVYARAIPELARVADRYIVVSVPREQDLTLGQVECTECATRFNPDYHFRSFGRAQLEALFSGLGFRCTGIQAYGTVREFVFSRSLERLRRDHGNRFPVDILCVACGAVLPGRAAVSSGGPVESASQQRAGVGARVKALVKAAWPKRSETRWLLAIYERCGEPGSRESSR